MRKVRLFSSLVIAIAIGLHPALTKLEAQDGGRLTRWNPFRRHRESTNSTCAAPQEQSCVPATASPVSAKAAPVRPAPAEEEAEEEESPGVAAIGASPAMFSAPPSSGEITGATSSYGVRLPSITLPEMRLQLPTVQMPSIVRTARDAEMYVDGGRAPRVFGAPAAYGPLMNAGFTHQPSAAASPAPRKTPAKAKPAEPDVKPAPVSSPASDQCVPANVAPTPIPDNSIDTAQQELIETRRALMIVTERLDQLQRGMGSSPHTPARSASEQVPPSPATSSRRSKAYDSVAAAKLPRPQQKIMEASYSESDDEGTDEQKPTSVNSKRRKLPADVTSEQWKPASTNRPGAVRRPGSITESNDDATSDEYEDRVGDESRPQNRNASRGKAPIR